MSYPFVKGHGTENDFVLLPDADGSLHGDLDAERVRSLCDRRAGIGGDGVIRVITSEALGVASEAEWFMDYANSDGSLAEMCGNGIRVLARYLLDEGLVAGPDFVIGTRDGEKQLHVDGDQITVDLGNPVIYDLTTVAVEYRSWSARHVTLGNPHAVAFVTRLDDAGALTEEPTFDRGLFPAGVNIEFVVRQGPQHIAMRVHERGAGETRSCGTGACAAVVATATADAAARNTPYRVDVPGGTLVVTWTDTDRVLLSGPAVLVARGTTDL